MTMRSFLEASRHAVSRIVSGKLIEKEAFHMVLGNTSCDLDSAVCALVHSWFLSNINKPSDTTIVPCLSIAKDELSVRTETVSFLKHFNVSPDSLLFLKNVDLNSLACTKLSATLVDHHKLPSGFDCLETHVTEVIDHRQLECERPSPVQTIVKLVGSCATIIAERILKALESNQIEPPSETTNEILTMLAFSTHGWSGWIWIIAGNLELSSKSAILIDTENLQLTFKVTPDDVAMIDAISQRVSRNVLDQLYEKLQRAKYDTSTLTTRHMIIKDPKYIDNGKAKVKTMMSSITEDFSTFVRRGGVESDVLQHCVDEMYDVWVALTRKEADEDGKEHKTLMVYSKHTQYKEKIINCLKTTDTPNLQIQEFHSTEVPFVTVLRMYNTGVSRKQVLPVVQAAIHDME